MPGTSKSEKIRRKILPSPEIIITSINKIIKAFENTVQTELIKVGWEEIKKLRVDLKTKAFVL